MTIDQIETRFKDITNLHDIDLSKSLIRKSEFNKLSNIKNYFVSDKDVLEMKDYTCKLIKGI